MDVLKAISKRRSIRSYFPKPIETDKLQRILESARIAPSAKSKYEWRMIVVRDKETKEKLVSACKGQKFVAQADTVIVSVGTNPDYIMSCGQSGNTVDITIALQNLVTQATEEGLGSCWICAFYPDKVKKILDIPKEYSIPAIILLGYSGEEPKPASRKEFSELFYGEKWEQEIKL